jgi:hypothetical protein
MPFCTKCGHEASGADTFCARCGARQSGPAAPPPHVPPPPMQDPLAGLSPRTAAILCYVPAIGWIAAIIVLAARKFKENHLIRFHAFQGLYLFAAWLVVDWVVGPISRLNPSHHFPLDTLLPIIGELAQRSVTEQ